MSDTLTRFVQLSNKIKSFVFSQGPYVAFKGEITISPDQRFVLTPQGAVDFSNHGLGWPQVIVRAYDNQVGSPTYGYAINSESIVTVGYKTNGEIVIVNDFEAAVTLNITVILHSIKSTKNHYSGVLVNG